jgi:thiamine-monophosphate kinase|nr:MAG: thiamine-phosphate kinase [Pseudomonadota bacterium]
MTDNDQIRDEDTLIQSYFAPLAAGFPGAFGLEEDCAALTPEPGHDLVLKTDAIAEGIHFRPEDAPEDVAWKALAVNVSDLAAKAARPVGYLLSIAFQSTPDRAWLERFSGGLKAAQERFGIVLMGGDTDRRPNAPLSVTITAIGSVPAGRMVRRGTARPGDLVYVSGTLGDSAIGLKLHSQSENALQLAAADRIYLKQRYLRPMPRLQLRDALLCHARAAMDISDGLVKDLGRLCRASRVAATVRADAVPISEPARRAIALQPELSELPLTGGDDYEILATVAPEDVEAFDALARAAGIQVTQIGSVHEGTGALVLGADGQPLNLQRRGYDHFRA